MIDREEQKYHRILYEELDDIIEERNIKYIKIIDDLVIVAFRSKYEEIEIKTYIDMLKGIYKEDIVVYLCRGDICYRREGEDIYYLHDKVLSIPKVRSEVVKSLLTKPDIDVNYALAA